MFWRIVGTLGAGSFVLGGLDIASTTGCGEVDFGGSARSSTYTCTFGEYPGEMSAGAASLLMIFGGIAVIALLWMSVIRNNRSNF
jgi:hypothetical protein